MCYAGTCRPVRRQEYPPDSAPALGVMWQWEGDIPGVYHPYSTEVASFLEKAHHSRASVVDLNRHPFSLPYVIRLSNMLQIRNGTNYRRRVQRVQLPQPYMPTSSNFSHSAVVSPFAVPVLQPAVAAAHGSSDPSGSGFPIPGMSQVNLGSLSYLPLFPTGRSSAFRRSSTASSAPMVGSSGSVGPHGGGMNCAVFINSSLVSNSSSVDGQNPLFTIGRPSLSASGGSGSTTKHKRKTRLRNVTPYSR